MNYVEEVDKAYDEFQDVYWYIERKGRRYRPYRGRRVRVYFGDLRTL